MQIVNINETQHRKAAIKILKNGGVVGIPTETVYGLAAKFDHPEAIEKIFWAKERPKNDPLIVHVSAFEEALPLWNNFPLDWNLEKCGLWPSPLTIVWEKSSKILDIVTSNSPFVAIRMPQHSGTLQLIKESGFPLVAPSANRFGRISPTKAEHVFQELGERIDLILDGGACPIGLESTIIKGDPVLKQWTVLRQGGADLEKLKLLTGWTIQQQLLAQPTPLNHSPFIEHQESPQALLAPGLFLSHYASSLETRYGFKIEDFKSSQFLRTIETSDVIGIIFWNSENKNLFESTMKMNSNLHSIIHSVALSEHNSYHEMANHFYDELRQVDLLINRQLKELPLRRGIILIEEIPLLLDHKELRPALYLALIDRVLKASQSRWNSLQKIWIDKQLHSSIYFAF